MATTPMTIGWIGLGQMGQAHVMNLLKKLGSAKIVIWNRDGSKCANAVSAGASQVKSAREVVEASDITFVMLSSPAAAMAVYQNEEVKMCTRVIPASESSVITTITIPSIGWHSGGALSRKGCCGLRIARYGNDAQARRACNGLRRAIFGSSRGRPQWDGSGCNLPIHLCWR